MRLIDLDQIEFLKVDGNKEFNHGVDCCINRLLRAEPIAAIPLDKVKQAREEIENIKPLDFLEITKKMSSNGKEMEISKKFATAILDKLIAESEGKE